MEFKDQWIREDIQTILLIVRHFNDENISTHIKV